MRKLNLFWTQIVRVLSIALVIFQLYTTAQGPFSDIIQRGIHLAFVLTLLFILKPATKSGSSNSDGIVPWYDICFALISCAACIYIVIIADAILYDPLKWVSKFDLFASVTLVALILEASRRSVGWTFPILGIFFLIYALWGEVFPGVWGHQNFSFNFVFQTFYHNTRGIWGTMLGLSATMLAMFGIFGAILAETGGAETFIKIGQRLTGRYVGGAGKVAICASMLFGMISGSAIGNVAATGVFTIPSMKKAGYTNEWAAALEAIASTGGQIMPPIMGAAAFIMSQLIGIPYLIIAKAALIPALIYFSSCYIAVHLNSKKNRIQGSPEKPFILFIDYIVIFVPLVIFIFLLIKGYTVLMGAFYATVGALIVYVIKFSLSSKNLKKTVASTSGLCLNAAINGTRSIVDMCGILAGAQITVSLINLSGFGVKLSDIIVSLGQGNIFLCLVCSMIVCIILGMGLPTTAAYVLGAAVLASPLIALGLDPLAVHLFVFYYACLSAITPPVCVAVFMAAGLAKAQWLKVGGIACMIALPSFVIPFTFAYNPALLFQGTQLNIIFAFITALLGVCLIDICLTGFLKSRIGIVYRLLFLVCGFFLLIPSYRESFIGLALTAITCVMYLILGKRKVY